jgi:formate hydrogenlyase subunit 6/NADH:ubiquinone oxidoreductase subunit I
VHIGAKGRPISLAHGDCANCTIGDPHVLHELAEKVERAREVLALHHRELEVTVGAQGRLEVPEDRREVSRREVFAGGWAELRRGSGTLLAPLERLADHDESLPDRRALPEEHQRLRRAIALAEPAPHSVVPLRIPEVLDGCILCPACTRACPTNAIKRVFDGDAAGGSRIELEPDRCIGCDACVSACPVDVVRMRDDVTWGEIEGPPQIVYRAQRASAPLGAVDRSASETTTPEVAEHDASVSPPDASSS